MPTITTSRITWDEAENRIYEYGVSQGVFFRMADNGLYEEGKPWNGLINVNDSPEGADITKLWADGIQYAGIRGAEEYHGGIEAYTYPDEFAECDGSAQPIPGMTVGQQPRKKFGLCWRTEIGNANTDTYGYKIHIAYGMSASPTEKAHDTVNDSPDAQTFNWDTEGTPIPMTGYKPTAKLEFDSTKLGATKMAALENLLYGTSGTITYTEFTGSSFVEGTEYYENVDGHYVITEDESKQTGKTYYTKTGDGGSASQLLTPDAILAALQAAE